MLTPEQRRERARNAANKRHHPGATPEDLAAITAAWIERKLESAPPFTEEQLARLRAKLTPAGRGQEAGAS